MEILILTQMQMRQLKSTSVKSENDILKPNGSETSISESSKNTKTTSLLQSETTIEDPLVEYECGKWFCPCCMSYVGTSASECKIHTAGRAHQIAVNAFKSFESDSKLNASKILSVGDIMKFDKNDPFMVKTEKVDGHKNLFCSSCKAYVDDNNEKSHISGKNHQMALVVYKYCWLEKKFGKDRARKLLKI